MKPTKLRQLKVWLLMMWSAKFCNPGLSRPTSRWGRSRRRSISPAGLVAGLLSGRVGDLGLQTLGPKQPGHPPPGSAAAKPAAVVHRHLPVPPPDPGLASSSSRVPPDLPPPPLPPAPGKGSDSGKGYGPQTGRSQEPHVDDFAWAFTRGEPPPRFRKDGP